MKRRERRQDFTQRIDNFSVILALLILGFFFKEFLGEYLCPSWLADVLKIDFDAPDENAPVHLCSETMTSPKVDQITKCHEAPSVAVVSFIERWTNSPTMRKSRPQK